MKQEKQEKQQIDEMINEGLGGGTIDNEKDRKQLENPISKKNTEDTDKDLNTMTANFADMKKLGKEMESMETKKEIKKQGLTSDPIQE
ncbi:hypothetical protein H1D32_10850 [Anaerobacillus sp. CMMVII]|uniref:hypothetical protein n=1 Tax=Anaerobacillus sp. CMMVII TaxID=2755588 RepID=UPI0021B76000|nr:hypothetical protein [Anaerobacillus sp. CMMVII]MCT8138210.1 hypothetical protein [Anaerobacillus sp. CMMVII]